MMKGSEGSSLSFFQKQFVKSQTRLLIIVTCLQTRLHQFRHFSLNATITVLHGVRSSLAMEQWTGREENVGIVQSSIAQLKVAARGAALRALRPTATHEKVHG